MAVSHSQIKETLRVKLAALPACPVIAWEGVSFTSPVSGPFLKVDYLPVGVRQATAGTNGLNELTGIFQVTVCVPDGAGDGGLYRLVDAVLNHFPRGTVLTASGGSTVTVSRSVPSPMLDMGGYLSVPVSVYFRSFQTN